MKNKNLKVFKDLKRKKKIKKQWVYKNKNKMEKTVKLKKYNYFMKKIYHIEYSVGFLFVLLLFLLGKLNYLKIK